jgi:RsiW-degrading membrane proteinase PrsW (M82 family)
MRLPLLVLSSLAPALVVLWLFYRRDLHPEPKAVVLQTFLRGIVAILPSCLVALGPYLAIQAWVASPLLFGALYAVFGAALPEECCKYWVLTRYSARQPSFNEPMDGVVYGAAAALGFVAVENLLYGINATWGMVLFRIFTALPAHACWGAMMGYYVGQARCNPRWASLPRRGLAVVIGFHILYDFPFLSLQKMQTQWPNGVEDYAQAVWVVGCLGAALGVNLVSLAWTIQLVRRLRRARARG